jgi:hypothetical protein
VDDAAVPPAAWCAYALVRARADAEDAAKTPPLSPPRRSLFPRPEALQPLLCGAKLLLLLDVFDSAGDVVFSARLDAPMAEELDACDADTACASEVPYEGSQLLLDAADAAEEFAELRRALHAPADAAPAAPAPAPADAASLLLFHCEGANAQPDDVAFANEGADDADSGSGEAEGGAVTPLSAVLCAVRADGRVAVLRLGLATADADVEAHFRFGIAPAHHDGDGGEEALAPVRVLRWARTFSQRSGADEDDRAYNNVWASPPRAAAPSAPRGADVLLNIYCTRADDDEEEEEADEDAEEEAVAAAAAAAAVAANESCGSDSDVSAGEAAVRDVAAARAAHLARLRDALRANAAASAAAQTGARKRRRRRWRQRRSVGQRCAGHRRCGA